MNCRQTERIVPFKKETGLDEESTSTLKYIK